MNISLRFLLPSAEKQEKSLKKGSVTGTAGDLTYSLAAVALAGMPLISPFTDGCDYTGIYSRSTYI